MLESGEVSAYSARLKDAGKLPAVVAIHENRGLNKHIEDVTRRAALAGFLSIAPDALSPLGGTPGQALVLLISKGQYCRRRHYCVPK